MSNEDCQVYTFVFFLTLFGVVIFDGHFALSGHCLATNWFGPAAILLELDFLSLCLETRALRNTYLDNL